MYAWIIVAVLIALAAARWAYDNHRLTECETGPTVICPSATEDQLVANYDDAHRTPDVVRVQAETAQTATPTGLTFVPDDTPWFIPRPRLTALVNPAAIAAMRMGYGDGLPAGFRFGTQEATEVTIEPTNPTTATVHLEPAAILVAYGDHTAHLNALVPISGSKVHVNDKGIVPIHVVTDEHEPNKDS